ncbi:MAG: glycine zipper 2TM domain-containing protein [Bacillota bacterium]
MKTLAIAVASAITAIAPAAFAQYDRYGNPYPERPYYNSDANRYDADRYDTARVLDAQPVYASAREECWNPRSGQYEERREHRDRVGAGTAAGAVIGGVLGHQVDRGVGTAAGAILGGIAGHEIEKDRARDDDLDLSNCRAASNDSGAIDGYNVRYAYHGQEYVTRMSYDPGPTLRVGQDINNDGTPFNPAG